MFTYKLITFAIIHEAFLNFRGDKHEGFGDIDVALGAEQYNKACEMHIKEL
jgi:hypothetical protein